MFKRDAPLLMNPKPGWHKYSWMAEFVGNIGHYRQNTIATTRLAIEARQHLFAMAERENISFDLERRGILHICHDKAAFEAGMRVNTLLQQGGLDRRAVTPEEIRSIEPTLRKPHYGGFFTPSDATGDIHKFTRGLAEACIRRGATFIYDADIDTVASVDNAIHIGWNDNSSETTSSGRQLLQADGIVICAGVASRHFAAMLGDRVNVYPVKGYSITVNLDATSSRRSALHTSACSTKPPRSSPAVLVRIAFASQAPPSSTTSTATSAPIAFNRWRIGCGTIFPGSIPRRLCPGLACVR